MAEGAAYFKAAHLQALAAAIREGCNLAMTQGKVNDSRRNRAKAAPSEVPLVTDPTHRGDPNTLVGIDNPDDADLYPPLASSPKPYSPRFPGKAADAKIKRGEPERDQR